MLQNEFGGEIIFFADITSKSGGMEMHGHERIKITVQNGWITLSGEVDLIYQKEAAENALRNLVGIRGLDNEIIVKTAMVKPQDVIAKIENAFQRNAIPDARRIIVDIQDDKVILNCIFDIEIKDGIVTLSGAIPDAATRRAGINAAKYSSGVTRSGTS